MLDAASTTPRRRILWQNVSTVMSAAVLISAEVFGAAFAGGWALANVLGIVRGHGRKHRPKPRHDLARFIKPPHMGIAGNQKSVGQRISRILLERQ